MNRRGDRWICSGALAATLAACSFGSPDSSASATSCATDTLLRTADGVTETECPWGCLAEETPHCAAFTPAGGVLTAADLDPAQLLDIELSDTTINTDTGEITNVRGPGPNLVEGIDFQTRDPRAAVFRLKSLRITGPVRLRGNRALAIVAQGAITIEAEVDGRGDPICGNNGRSSGPGGFDGGDKEMAAPGMGSGSGTTTNEHGGGGGGHGGDGGDAGGGAAGGTAFGTAEIAALFGGGGGGGGAGGGDAGSGGGGGAAIQLVSNTSITIAAGGGINAGGCGGYRGGGGGDGGGGGGAGGMILLEAPSVTIAGKLAVNGGGGGTQEVSGDHATLTRTPAPGGKPPTAADGMGGTGGAASTLVGGPGMGGTFGGGGGGVGRMRFHTRTGEVDVQAGSLMSPALDDSPTSTTQGPASVQ